MTPTHLIPEFAYSSHPPTSLEVYRRVNPQTDCPYPFLAATRDRSTSLLLGHHQASFELTPSGETRRWLPDFAPTRVRVSIDLAGIGELVGHVFVDTVDCGVVQFDAELRVSRLTLVLVDEGEVDYAIRAFGRYERVELDKRYRVGAAEKALLHACCAMGAALARRVPSLLREPSTRSEQSWAGDEQAARAAVRSR